VSVRVEGESSTLLPLTSVTPEAPEPVSACPVNSATTAINLAVNGNWDHGEAKGAKGDFTETILGETHNFTHESDTWAVWINDKWAGGICEDLLAEGDEVLLVADHEPPPYAPTVLPLVLAGTPASVVAGSPFTVQTKLVRTRAGNFAEIGEGTPVPQGGVVVSGGGATATSNENGTATLCFSKPGSYTLIARKPGDAPSAPVSVSVRGGSESACGGQLPSSPKTSGEQAASSTHPPYVGPFALVPHLQAPVEGHFYAHGHGPRLLAGAVSAHSAVSSVSLKLRRRYRGRCYAFDGTAAVFRRARCGQARAFRVSSNALFSYFLPQALGPGRYVLDVESTDAVGNHTSLARGTSRIVFYVR
jgi:hypothetical protein